MGKENVCSYTTKLVLLRIYEVWSDTSVKRSLKALQCHENDYFELSIIAGVRSHRSSGRAVHFS